VGKRATPLWVERGVAKGGEKLRKV